MMSGTQINSFFIWLFIVMFIVPAVCKAQQVVKTDSIVIVVDSVKCVDIYYAKTEALLDSVDYLNPIYEIYARKVTVNGDSIVPDTMLVRLGAINKSNAVIFDISILGRGLWSFGYRGISREKGVEPGILSWQKDEKGKLMYVVYNPPDKVMIKRIRKGGMIGIGTYKR
jgi:hypothetical protein